VLARVLWTIGVWAFAGTSCLLFLADSTIGPTLFSMDYAHGIHLGDLVAVVAFPAWAWWVSRSFWVEGPERSDGA
jgi:hypothetical protein